MRRLVAFSVAHPLVGNLLMGLLLVLGGIALLNLKRETFPDLTLDVIEVKVVWPGASPQEVERGVCAPVEEAVRVVAGIDRVQSVCAEHGAVVGVSLQRGADAEEALRGVKSEVDALTTLPEAAEEPVVSLLVQTVPVIDLVLHGPGERAALADLAEALRQRLLDEDTVSQVDLVGVPGREIVLELEEAALERYGLTFDAVAAAVSAASVDLSSGSVRGAAEEIRIRTFGKRYEAEEFADIVLHADPRGRVVRVGDVARVVERFDAEDDPDLLFFDGDPAVALRVTRTDAEDTLTIVETVQAFREREHGSLPPGLSLSTWADMSKILRDRINLLLRNGALGLALVLLSLTVFLSLRLSFWVAVGIPVSFAGTFLVVAATGGITINAISLFGLIIVTGILVDDAIVVSENVFTHVQGGADPRAAAVAGTVEVAPAVIASVLTTMVTFCPLFFVGGMMGEFVWQIGAVVVIALGMSLVECLFVLPAHLAHSLELRLERDLPGPLARGARGIGATVRRGSARVRGAIDRGFAWWVEKAYVPVVRLAVRRPWTTVLAAAGTISVCAAIVQGGWLEFVFFPRIDSDDVAARFVLAPGTPAAAARDFTERVEGEMAVLARELREEDPQGRDVVLRVRTSIGRHSVQNALLATVRGSEVVEVAAELLPNEEDRAASSQAIVQRLAERIGPVPGAQQVYYGNRVENTFGKPLQLGILGDDRARLRAIADRLKDALREYPGVHGVGDDSPRGKREVHVELTETGRALGLTLAEIALQLRAGFYGREVQQLQRGRDEVDVVVRYPDAARRGLGDLAQARIRTRDGRSLPLSTVARWAMEDGTVWLKRLDGEGVIQVHADVDEARTNAAKVLSDLDVRVLPELVASDPGVRISKEGQQHEQEKVFGSTAVVVPAAALIMMVILVLVFESFAQGLLVLLMIPLGFVGMVLSHLLWGLPLTVLSVLGFIALSGVVINDSVVFVDKINALLREGEDVREAAVRGGRARFRAILLTTLTTAAGLGPIVFETSLQAQFLIPMALTLAGGLLVGTFFTLLVLPAAFLCLNDLRRVVRWLRVGRWPDRRAVEPAARPQHPISA